VIDFSRLPREQVEQAVIRMSFDDRAAMSRRMAIVTVLDFNDLAATKLVDSNFDTAVTTIAGKLSVAVPSVPADLATLSDAQLVALAASMALAEADYQDRIEALAECKRYWTTIVESGGTAPTSTTYLNRLLALMNYVRAARGLSAVS
jgi:hypothetical protein